MNAKLTAFLDELQMLCHKHDVVLLHQEGATYVAPVADHDNPLGGFLYCYAGRVGYFYSDKNGRTFHKARTVR